MLICPKCYEELVKQDCSYLCANNHCYDIAKEGYVNLILANQKHSSLPGDNLESLACRNDFLNAGYYQPLAENLTEILKKYTKDGDVLLDAGCGTGYYLNYVINHLHNKINYYATDISKKGVSITAKKCKQAVCFVGNVFHLPFSQQSIDCLMSVFTPYSSQEFNRVVKDNGYVIAVNAGKDHLINLKEIVYQDPYLNQESGYQLDGFKLIEQFNVKYEIELKNNQDINNLWKMMPYYHTSKLEDSNKLLKLNKVKTKVDFFISVYRKEQ